MHLTSDEQIYMVNGQSLFGMGEIPEKDVPRLQLLDGGTGLNLEQLCGDLLIHAGRPGYGSAAYRRVIEYFYQPDMLETDEERALYDWLCEQLRARIPDMTAPGCYPPGMLLGATWDPETVYAVGKALGHEARAYGVHVLLGTPNVNLHRDPRNGRLFEGYSEDPYLITKLAPALVRGVQSEGVAANVKHFAANNQETNRVGINEYIPERALHELYLPGFEACVRSGCATVMAAYNQINGVPCTENQWLLTGLLRNEWGFDGLVMSDWGAIFRPAEAVSAGCDLNMPGPVSSEPLRKSLAAGLLDPERLAESAERAVTLARRYALPPTGHIDTEMTGRAAYNAAAEGIVMLENYPRDQQKTEYCCPLPKESKIALMGTLNGDLLFCGEGSACIRTNRNSRLCAELRKRFAAAQTGLYDGADVLIYVLNVSGQEGNDKKTIRIPQQEQEKLSKLGGYARRRDMRSVLLINASGPVTGWALNSFDAMFFVSLPGMQGAAAIADILCGKINPSGRLPLTFPYSEYDLPTCLNFPGDGLTAYYGEGIFVGYRYFVTWHHRDIDDDYAMYNFGYGLSYSTFEVKNLRVTGGDIAHGLDLAAEVENTGKAAGKTVVQVYLHDPVSALTKPVCTLCAFRKVFVEPGQTVTVQMHVDRRAFESWDPNLRAWTLEDGQYILNATVGDADAIDWRSRFDAVLRYDGESPYSWGEGTSIREIIENPDLKAALQSFMQVHGLPWEKVLWTYEYIPQERVGKTLRNAGCSAEALAEWLQTLRSMRHLKR